MLANESAEETGWKERVVRMEERWVHLKGIGGECPVCGAPAHPVARIGLRDGFGFWAHDSGARGRSGSFFHGPGELETMIEPHEFSCLVKDALEKKDGSLVAMRRRPVRCVETGKVYPSMSAAARGCGGTAEGISSAAAGGGKYHGTHWEFDGSEMAEVEKRLVQIADGAEVEGMRLDRGGASSVVAGILGADGYRAPEGVAALDDGFVVKNRLPALAAVEFKTESQWRMLGFSLMDGARAVPMHPTGFLGGKTCDYYHVSDVEAMDTSPEFASAFARRQENLATLIAASTGHGGLKANFPWCDGF